ncbi:MAG: hypothetical protein WC249_01650 [Patescibacteria group bacterium]|jgi:hypothetical protein
MNNRDLISKLNSFKKVNPDQKWLDSNRELLLSQISNSGAESLSVWKNLLITLTSLSKAAAQPVYALGIFVLLLIGGSFFSQGLLAQTKPNDSLYIARIIAESVKLNTTFDSVERNKLALQYASGHAQDISSVLANPEFNNAENSAQVAKLNTSFNEEVKTVKNRIKSLVVPATGQSGEIINNSTKSESVDLVIADSFKDRQGISLEENNLSESLVNGGEKVSSGTEKIKATGTGDTLNSGATLTATTTNLNSSTTLEIINPASTADKILDEAQKLFDSKNYSQAADKLKEVEKIIN